MPTGIYKRKKHWKLSEETKKKISIYRKGRKHLNRKSPIPFSEEHRKKLSEAQKGKKHSKEIKRKISKNHRHYQNEKTRKKISESMKGENNPNWKGGIISENRRIRNSIEYRLWREAIFKRDNYTCIWCGDNRGGNLEADHIKPFAYYPELRFAIDNGRTLCVDCHKKTDTYGVVKKQILEGIKNGIICSSCGNEMEQGLSGWCGKCME